MVASDFCLTDQGLYFINRMDSDCVYLCGRDGVGSLKISNEPALSVEYDGEKVTMILKSDGKEVIFDNIHSISNCREVVAKRIVQKVIVFNY